MLGTWKPAEAQALVEDQRLSCKFCAFRKDTDRWELILGFIFEIFFFFLQKFNYAGPSGRKEEFRSWERYKGRGSWERTRARKVVGSVSLFSSPTGRLRTRAVLSSPGESLP